MIIFKHFVDENGVLKKISWPAWSKQYQRHLANRAVKPAEEAFHKSLTILLGLHHAIKHHGEESKEVDDLRDMVDDCWCLMDRKSADLCREVSENLIRLSECAIVPHETKTT